MRAKQRREKASMRRAATLHPFPPNRERVVVWVICIFLVAIVWIAFGRTLGHDFVNYDDNDYVWENPRITSGLTLNNTEWAFTHVHADNWHPLTTISHMLDVQLYGLQPWGHHLTNVVLHTVAALLLFLALRSLVLNKPESGSGQFSTLNLFACGFVSALFAIHPLRVESVAWISERKDVLSGAFFMLTLLAYARYVRSDRNRFKWYAIVAMLFALGLMCKPTLVTLPFVLLLLDYWPLGRWQAPSRSPASAKLWRGEQKSEIRSQRSIVRGLVVEKIPLFALSVASCVATILAQQKVLQKSLNISLTERVANAVVSYVTYLSEMFYPVHLAVLYPFSKDNLRLTTLIFDLGLLLIISAISLLWLKKYPFLLVGWLWYLGMLVPVIGIVQVGVQTRADRYNYLPQIGLYILVTWAAIELFKRLHLRSELRAAAAVGAVITLTACTYHEVSFWKDGETLWRHAISNTANNYIAHYSLGNELLRKHQIDAALVEFEKAVQINPECAEAELNVGVVLLQKGNIDGAISHTEKAVQIDPSYYEAEYNLGNLLQQRGQPDEAISHYRKALAAKPNYAEAHNSLGASLAQNGQLDQAIAEFGEALRLKPIYAEAQSDLGNALASQHKFDQAISHHLEALRLNPNSPPAHYNLGFTLLQAGRRDEAVTQFTETLRLDPDYTAAKQQLYDLGLPSPQ